MIAAFLEFAAQRELETAIGPEQSLSAVSIEIDYQKSSAPEDMTATVEIKRLARRVAFVEAVGRQAGRDAPVARAQICFRILD